MPRPNDEEPIATPSDRGTRYNHPAFAQIRASRVSGHQTLYGSDFIHHNYVTVSICRSELERHLSNDWPYGKQEIIEVMMSEAQWASMISSMNVGSGVQCTLNHLNGKPVPGIPFIRQVDSEFRKEALESVSDAVAEIDKALAAVDALGLSKPKAAQIRDKLTAAKRSISSTLPYVAEQFDEHMEETVEKAKAEINAYMVHTVSQAGLEAIAGRETVPLLSTRVISADPAETE